MAGHEWEDWFEREEFIGQISDIRVQNLQVEREVVQKRTFTRWMNLHLEKCNPPMEVHDLFRDIQDGRILMALLEELSGCRLLHAFKPSSHRIFRLNNIAKVLTFLEERNVKLVSIDAADIADGNSSIVLGLIWNIILFFQIKELTGNIKNQFPSSSSLSSIPNSSDSDTSHSSTPSDERKPSIAARDHGKAIKTLLHWVQRRTRKYGVAVQDFGKSWSSGLAFLAVIKSIDPSLVDMRRALLRSSRENIEEAFRTAHYSLGIPRLLEPEDVTLDPPDEQSIMTYVSQFLEHFPGIEEDDPLDFLERSKVSARMNEPPVRNGVQKKREKSYLVKRDWVQPPPKIFISSITEEHVKISSPAQLRLLKNRPWASEDSSLGSSPNATDRQPLCRPLGLKKEASSASSSPQPSPIDSAMDSPDSWGEMASPIQQCCSEDSLSDLRYSTSPGELTSDHGSPLLPESVSQGQANAELFTDEGNFSLSSIESLQAKTTLLSEEEDAYRYILDLKDGSTSCAPSEDTVNDSNAEQTETSLVQNPEMVKPAFHDHSYGDSDSGYFPGHKDISTTEPDDVSKSSLLTDTDEQVSGFENTVESQSEHWKESLESSITEDFQKVPNESNAVAFFDDESECPVLKYERISISESEEDVEVELSEEKSLKDEKEENDMPDVFSCDTRTTEGSEICEKEHVHLRETEEVDHVLPHYQEPVVEAEVNNSETKDKADQICSKLELPQISPCSSLPGAAETEAEIQEKEDKAFGNEESGMGEEPVMKDLCEANLQAANSLAEKNFIEAPKVEEESNCELESIILNQLSVTQEGGGGVACDKEPSQDDISSSQEPAVTENNLEDEPNRSIGLLEWEPSRMNSTCEDALTGDERKLENQQIRGENVKEEEVSCNKHNESNLKGQQDEIKSEKDEGTFNQHDDDETKFGGQQDEMEHVKEMESSYSQHHAIDSEELTESKSDMHMSEIAQNDVLVSDIGEAIKEQNSDPSFSEDNKHSFTPPTPSSPALQPDWDHGAANQPCGGQSQATWEETTRIMGTAERVERYPVELRLSLSVTPLQPAPSQPSHTGSDTEQVTQGKVGEGSVESPEQSPFELWSRHPGEWGAVDSDLHTDHCELISSDEELSASTTAMTTATAARENTEKLREEAASDCAEGETQPSTALCLQESFDPKESKRENGETTDAIVTKNADESRKECRPAGNSESLSEVALPEIYLLLLMWLLIYCLFILPQIDIWAIPSLLLNLEK